MNDAHPELNIHLLGMNPVGFEIGNPSITSGRTIPWLQDVDSDGDGESDNWLTSWPYEYRDIVLVDAGGHVVNKYNLTTHDLSVAANYATLRQMVIDAAQGNAAGAGWTNEINPLDVNNDSLVTPIDALFILNELNSPAGAHELGPRDPSATPVHYLDTNGDGFVSPIDALLIINKLNEGSSSTTDLPQPTAAIAADRPSGEGESAMVLDAAAIAAALDDGDFLRGSEF